MKWYLISKIFLTLAGGLDIHSSIGGREMHPLAACGPNRVFCTQKAVPIKVGAVVGLLAAEKYLIKDEKASTAINFAVGAVWTGSAIRNYRIQGATTR